MLEFQSKRSKTATFLEEVAEFDFDKYYTTKVRIACHLLVWAVLSSFIFLNLLFAYGLNLVAAIGFMGRSLVCNASFFYLFFYFFIPNTLFKNRIVLALLSFIFCVVLWLVLNHYCFVVIHNTIHVNIASVRESVRFGANQSLLEVLSPKYIAAEFMLVLYSVSPSSFIKILFDIIGFYSSIFKAERKTNQLEIEKLNLESNFLKAQLNPHFLFNTLNNLYGLALRKDEHIPDIILHLSAIMRYILYESNMERVLLTKELTFIRNYVLLEKIRYKREKKIILDIDESNVDNQQIAPLMTFVFIENAFKYGLKSGKDSFLEIKIFVSDRIFYFSVLNDKDPTYVYSEEKKFGGIGVENVKKRLELLYPGKYQLDVDDKELSFGVKLQIEME
ncbi:histidine kinase [Chitinophaga ginsengisegetis]|uniref:sensor histidine kinase n=1 Tax=Chitinophaga ginsengisegetis TaxID=393003 RepID=UPI0034141123